MKTLSEFKKKLPKSGAVVGIVDFIAPTVQHTQFINRLLETADRMNANAVLGLRKSTIPSEDRIKFLNKIYPNMSVFEGVGYKDILSGYSGTKYIFCSVDEVSDVREQHSHITILSSGSINPDIANAHLIEVAYSGDTLDFKDELSENTTRLDARQIMNCIRKAGGLAVIREEVKFEIDNLREDFYQNKIFNIDEFVVYENSLHQIISRGSNYVTLVNESGQTFKKFIHDIKVLTEEDAENFLCKTAEERNIPIKLLRKHYKQGVAYWCENVISSTPQQYGIKFVKENIKTEGDSMINENIDVHADQPAQLEFKGYKTKNFDMDSDIVNAFQDTISKYSSGSITDPVAILNAIKATDAYLGIIRKAQDDELITKQEVAEFFDNQTKAKESLSKVGEFPHHEDYYHEQKHAVEMLYLSSKKPLAGEIEESKKDLKADTAKQDAKTMAADAPKQTKAGSSMTAPHESDNIRLQKVQYHLGEEAAQNDDSLDDTSEEALDRIVAAITDDDILNDVYDDSEFSVVDDETGDFVEKLDEADEEECVGEDKDITKTELTEELITEVLSRSERIRARLRLARTSAKRERALKIALNKFSNTQQVNKRARRLAIKAIKRRILRGRDMSKISVAEKERIEKRLERMKSVINRIAVKMIPRVRKLEKERLSHRQFTKK